MADRMAAQKEGRMEVQMAAQMEDRMAAQKVVRTEVQMGAQMEVLQALEIPLQFHPLRGFLDLSLRTDSPEPVAPGKPVLIPFASVNHRLLQMQHRAYCPPALAFPLLESVLQMFFFPPWRTPHSGHTARLK